ncbi:MAG: cupin domain-containing protein [Myxococcota bacterium]|nr:cupin domain-containing protein [Myxococcota bacterium]
MNSVTDDQLIGFYEAALGPLHNPTADWLADALVWLRRIVVAETMTDAVKAAMVWTGEREQVAAELAEKLRAAAGHPVPIAAALPERNRNVTHVLDVTVDTVSRGSRFSSRCQNLSAATAAQKLGCSLYEVAPGKRAFPLHAHFGTEEALFVLSGKGTLRIGDERIPVRAGSYASFPPGPDTAHQLVNTGSTPLRYLCMSSASDPDVVVYPDSGKVMAAAGGWPPTVHVVARAGDRLDYWDGEDVG